MSHKMGQRNDCACIRGNSGTQSLEMAGIHFLHRSPPPCVYTHMAFIIVFPLPNDPNPKKQGRPVLEIFRGRQICPAYFRCLGMDQAPVVWKRTVLTCWRAPLATLTGPPPRKEHERKKKAEKAGRKTEHASSKVFLLHSGVRQVLHFRRLW